MKTFFRSAIWFIALYFIPVAGLDGNTEADDSLGRLRQQINSLLNTAILKKASIGIRIVSVDLKDVLYEHNAEMSLNPASNTKLITSATALVKLTPQYQFTTTVYTAARLKDGRLDGDVYLKGGGDPTLLYEHLLQLAQELHNLGIRTIAGNVVGDDTFFDDEREFSGWQEFSTAYSGRISALSLQQNAVNVTVKSASRSGGTPQILLNPPTSYLHVKSTGVKRSGKNSKEMSWSDNDSETVVVRAKTSKKARAGISVYVSIKNPSLFTTTTFKDALEQIGVRVEGNALSGKVPAKSVPIAVHYSEPLSSIVCASNKSSSNFVAEQILKTVGAEIVGAPGSTEKGLSVVQGFLAELGIAPQSYILENGSGLSRNNRLSPAQIVRVLSYMYENFGVRAEFMASLAIAGVDGTLERRMKDTQAERNLRAKTGAINQVSCLSGYAASKNNEVFAFSIMMNDYRSGGYVMKNIQNRIGLLLTEFSRPPYNVARSGEIERTKN